MAETSQIFREGLLEGQVCAVSGGGSGLGRETALELARLGAAVEICGRRAEPLAETVATIESFGGTAHATSLDIRDDEAVEALFDAILERNGGLDVLVNNAGGQFLSPAEALSPHNGMPGMVHSGAARAAVENMMRTLSVEWARFNIKTCAIAAGQFGTETMRTKYPKEVVEGVPWTVPLGRMGTEEEWAWLVAYLASPAGDFFSGCVITMDGGRDNWFGSWPPGPTGVPAAEQRKPK